MVFFVNSFNDFIYFWFYFNHNWLDWGLKYFFYKLTNQLFTLCTYKYVFLIFFTFSRNKIIIQKLISWAKLSYWYVFINFKLHITQIIDEMHFFICFQFLNWWFCMLKRIFIAILHEFFYSKHSIYHTN